ncbi:MAG: GTP-binding protein [Bradyrhizobium sp.]|uniref:CobW family GTP-binding protein n=1 Tax=Bradyrhizobium sp. TaxID=376 RepID=UPI001D473C4D|nr:GTP-binding protein [Bradyrhizobium sp.]MBV9566348.1 GTP-binding protein [Bradyrhizobium sp.]
MTEAPPAFTPVTLLTGFLGSGKTTLLRRLLADPALADTAVIINEFGEVALDHLLVERLDEDTVLLGSGCVCCTVRGELAATMRDLHSRRERGDVPMFRRLVIESTGLADPFPVLSTLRADPVLRHHFTAAGVVTTVDAVNGLAQLDRYVESMRQAAIADTIALTKTDIADPTASEALLARLQAINPAAPVLRVAERRLPVDALLRAGGNPFRAVAEPDGAAAHAKARAFSIVVDEPLDWSTFGIWLAMLLNRHGNRILRVKGLLALQGEARPVAVHGVQHLVHAPTHLQEWPDADRRSRLVFIVEGIDPDLIRRSFAAFARLGSAAAAALVSA